MGGDGDEDGDAEMKGTHGFGDVTWMWMDGVECWHVSLGRV